jgi:dienelactone hydrolase
MRLLALISGFLVLSALLAAQQALTFPPPKIVPLDRDTRETIDTRTEQLAGAVSRLKRLGVQDPSLADIEVFLKAARWIVKHDEFYGKDAGEWSLAVLDHGLLRASQQSRGEAPWLQSPAGTIVGRAYRSRIDGSLQPYAVTFPHDYAQDARKRYRIDVVLHGRDSGLTEVKFLAQHTARAAPKDLGFVQIDIFGRGNNAYRWAGESDVWEALENFLAVENFMRRGNFLDPARIVLRGFSMGGAGTWHLGLHRPDQFCVLGPGAGFTTTRGYVPKFPAKLPDYQEACLHIYDAVDYAENAFNVPIVAYSGGKDPQKLAADLMQARLEKLDIPMTHLVAPGLPHTFPAEWRQRAEKEYEKFASRGRRSFPRRVRFVTWTLRYPSCAWIDLMALDRHYHQARVEASYTAEEGYAVKTTNVRTLRLAHAAPGATREPVNVVIDGQKLDNVRPYLSRSEQLSIYLDKQAGHWAVVLPERLFVDRMRHPRKTSGLQGPIDDAFTAPFLCVRGTGTPWHQRTDQYARADLERFKAEWSKYLRADLPIKDDTDVTAEDIATKHLILFGDPGSNSLIRDVLPRLPLKWTNKSITWAGKEYDAAMHLPVLIYPSPLATQRYVVLNSGHTFHAADFAGTNALLYPRLGDHAILRLGDKKEPLAAEIQTAGLFDDSWQPGGGP